MPDKAVIPLEPEKDRHVYVSLLNSVVVVLRWSMVHVDLIFGANFLSDDPTYLSRVNAEAGKTRRIWLDSHRA